MFSLKNKPIHIVHFVHSFATGGLENGVVNIINNLPEAEYKHTIICITNHDEIFFQRITTRNISIIDLNKPQGKGVLWLFHCWQLLRQLKPDVCHTRNLSALEAQLPSFLARVPFRIHGEHGWDVSDLGGINKKYQLLRKIFKPLVHQYIALSAEAEDYLTEIIKVKVKKVQRICNGVDINKFTVNKNRQLLPKCFVDQNSVVFGTVGRLAEVKNQTFLVKAFAELWRKSPEAREKIRLIIVGDGVLLPKLKEIVNDVGAEGAVWFTGRRDDVKELMNQMDVFILPSLAEGISNTLLEAMASGLPFIATSVGGNADLVLPEHKNSHIVDVNNIEQLITAMNIYLNSPKQLEKDSQLVREHCVENFSIELMVNKYHQLYQKNN